MLMRNTIFNIILIPVLLVIFAVCDVFISNIYRYLIELGDENEQTYNWKSAERGVLVVCCIALHGLRKSQFLKIANDQVYCCFRCQIFYYSSMT